MLSSFKSKIGNVFCPIHLWGFSNGVNQSRFRPVRHLKMTVWTSVLWKIKIQLVEKWTEMVIKWTFVIAIQLYSEYTLVLMPTRNSNILPCSSISPKRCCTCPNCFGQVQNTFLIRRTYNYWTCPKYIWTGILNL